MPSNSSWFGELRLYERMGGNIWASRASTRSLRALPLEKVLKICSFTAATHSFPRLSPLLLRSYFCIVVEILLLNYVHIRSFWAHYPDVKRLHRRNYVSVSPARIAGGSFENLWFHVRQPFHFQGSLPCTYFVVLRCCWGFICEFRAHSFVLGAFLTQSDCMRGIS